MSEYVATNKIRAVRETLDPNTIVTVVNGFPGTLVYKDGRTGERVVWDNFGDEQEITFAELRNAKASNKRFFIDNWFMFPYEPEVIYALGVEQYYKNTVSVDEIDNLFSLQAAKLEKELKNLNRGQRKVVAHRAKQLFESGDIDSLKVMATIEKCLGIKLLDNED